MWSTVGPALGKIAPIAKIQNLTTKPCYPIFQSPCQTLGLLNLYMFLGQKLCIRTSERPLETLIPWLGDWVGDKNFCICSSEELLSLYTWGWTPPNLFGPSSSKWKKRETGCVWGSDLRLSICLLLWSWATINHTLNGATCIFISICTFTGPQNYH